MMPSWYEEIQRRKRGMQGPVPPDLMSGATPPFNPDAGSPLPQPWEMDPAVRGLAMPQPPARPPRPMEEEIGASPQMGAQQAMSQRVQDLEAARERQRTMPGWRKVLGGVLEGIGSGRRGGLGGIARVGGGALTGRNAVQEIEQDLPAYDRAADNERAMNTQAENLALRKQQLRQRQDEAEDAAENKALTRQNRLVEMQSNPNFEEIDPKSRPYDAARHSAAPTEMSSGRYFAPIRREVQQAENRKATIESTQAMWQQVPEDLRDILPMEKAPEGQINNAIRLKELRAQKAKDQAAREEENRRNRENKEFLVRLGAALNPSAAISRDKTEQSRQADTIAFNLLKRFPKYEDAIEAAKSDPDIPPELGYQVISRLETQRARQPKAGKLGALREAIMAGGGQTPANPASAGSAGSAGSASPKPATPAASASKHSVGERVTLKNGKTVTIKKINPDGTFEY